MKNKPVTSSLHYFISRNSGLLVTIVFIIVSFSINADGETYYVSSSSGNDTNAGTTPDAPWKNCPGIDAWSGSVQSQAGDTVLFNSAETWTAASGASLLEPVGGIVYNGSTWGTGTRAILLATGDLGRAVVTYRYDHPTEPTVVIGFDIDADSTITAGVAFHWGFAPTNLVGATKRLENCLVHDVFSLQENGDYKYGIVISAWGGDTISNIEIINCKVYNISRSGIVNYLGNDVPENLSTGVIIRGCDISNTGQDPISTGNGIAIKNHSIGTIVEYNYIHNTAGGGVSITTHSDTSFVGPENATVRYNIVRECGGRNASCGVNLDYIGDKSADIYGNLFIRNGNSALRFFDRLRDKVSVRFYNNTCYQNNQLAGNREIMVQCDSADIEDITITNNIICADSGIIPLIDDGGNITAHSNNLFYRLGGGTLVKVNGTNYTASDITTWETTALTDDPLFYNPADLPSGFIGTPGVDIKPNTDGFTLQESSPAKDNGADLGTDFNGSINSITRPYGNGWDIGAYEYNGEIAINAQKVTAPSMKFSVTTINNHVKIIYDTNMPTCVNIAIFDMAGKLIARIIRNVAQGCNTIHWDGSTNSRKKVCNGCYIIRLLSEKEVITERFIYSR